MRSDGNAVGTAGRPGPDHGAAAPDSGRGVPRDTQVLRIAVVAITVLLGLVFLRITQTVTLPLAFALFLVAVFWPLQRRLERRMPRWASMLVTLVAFLVAIALLVLGLWYSGEVIVERMPQYMDELRRQYGTIRSWAGQYGVDLPQVGNGGGGEGGEQAGGAGTELAVQGSRLLVGFVSGLVLVIAFFGLGLLEVRRLQSRLQRWRGDECRDWLDPVHRATAQFQRYIVVRTGVGLVTGILVGTYSLLIGLELAFVWGMMNFLLNYIPTLGSIVAVIPPALFALVQYDNPLMALAAGGGVAAIQLIMGNWVDPLVQGRYLSLSPLVVLFSVAFWGWIWGIWGAFLSVPLTIGIVILAEQFERTRWIPVFLAQTKDDS
jgi:predicted PurR-regulated permease PerM